MPPMISNFRAASQAGLQRAGAPARGSRLCIPHAEHTFQKFGMTYAIRWGAHLVDSNALPLQLVTLTFDNVAVLSELLL